MRSPSILIAPDWISAGNCARPIIASSRILRSIVTVAVGAASVTP